VSPEIGILHESAELLLVNKPEGIATIPERDLGVPSVQRLLEAARGERLWVVHRLDKEVSGALVFARSADAHRELCKAFESRAVEKTYLALVHGVVKLDSDVIDMPIREFGSGRMAVDPRGKPSRTGFRVLERGADCSLLEVELHTGRRHQIRVHLYAIEHPLVGDGRYGSQRVDTRLMLHAWKLGLPALSAAAPLPPSFAEELRRRGLRWAAG
jgi:RluA family pseudouridine synthase